MNRKLNVAGDRTFDDWTVTIYNDDAHNTRQAIVEWQGIAAGQGNEITGGSPAEYKKKQLSVNSHVIVKQLLVKLKLRAFGQLTLVKSSSTGIQTTKLRPLK